MCGERVFGNQEMMVHAATKHPDPRDAEIAALRAQLAEATRDFDLFKKTNDELREKVTEEFTKRRDAEAQLKQAEERTGKLRDINNNLKDENASLFGQLSAKDAELAETNRELDDAVELLKALGQQQMDDFKKHKAELEAMERECEALRRKLDGQQIPDVEVKEIHFKDGRMDAILKHPMVYMLANDFVKSFKKEGAVNCLEMAFTHDELGMFTVTIQKVDGKTPMMLRNEALAKLALYRKAVEPVKEADDELLFVMITDKEIPEAEQKRIAGMCVKAVRDCIRILGEAGNERT